MIEFKIDGADEVRRQLKRLGDAARADTLKDALEKASAPIVSAAKSKAPSGNIRDHIMVVNVIVKDEGEVVAEIGIPGGSRPAFYGLFYERGTGPRQTKGKGKKQFKPASRGTQGARPFLRPAADQQGAKASQIFFAEVKRKLEAVADG